MSFSAPLRLTEHGLDRIRPDVRAMRAYAVQDAHNLIKLDAMENPYRLPAHLQAELGHRLGQVVLNRYPGERVHELRQQLAQYCDLPPGHALMLGNGSDELISLLALACHRPGLEPQTCVLAPEPGFVMYAWSAQLQGLDFVGVPLDASFDLDVSAMCTAIAAHRPAITYLAYPNNPTANLWQEQAMRQVIAACAAVGGLVVIDEAYQPFASRTWLDVMRQEPETQAHVLLMRTLSKFGLAGVRLGYLLGAQALIAEIDKVRPPYNVSVLNTECALFALEHQAVFAEQAAAICSERERVLTALQQLPQVQPYPSQANMVLIRLQDHTGLDAATCFERLKARGVLVKNVSTMHPLLRSCLRLTVGTPSENTALLAALQAALTSK